MLHDDYTAAAALLQNDPQEGLRVQPARGHGSAGLCGAYGPKLRH